MELQHRDLIPEDQDIDAMGGAPKRYLPLQHVYSTTAPSEASPATGGMSNGRKFNAPKLLAATSPDPPPPPPPPQPEVQKPPLVSVFSRRRKRSRPCELDEKVGADLNEKRRIGSSEVVKLGPKLRECGNHLTTTSIVRRRKKPITGVGQKATMFSDSRKRWVRLSFDGVDPETLVGLQCKVYWPLDGDWYCGGVDGYDSETRRHHVKYEDGDEEDFMISNEKIMFHISRDDMKRLDLSYGNDNVDSDGLNYNEMIVLAAKFDDCQELVPGEIVWAKITGHAMWPAIVMDESLIGGCEDMNSTVVGRSVVVQFFGTHDFARVKQKQVISFLRGLLSSLHLKCKRPRFLQSLMEAKRYLNGETIPRRMLQIQKRTSADDCESTTGEDEVGTDSREECRGDEKRQISPLEGHKTFPLQIGDLKVISLGKIMIDSDHFKDGKFICPEGYTAVRKFTSIKDPRLCTLYKMEVLRDAESKFLPLFRVTLDNGMQFEGATPSACWNKIYERIRKMQTVIVDGSLAEGAPDRIYDSGVDMFGFSHPKVMKLIKELVPSMHPSNFSVCKFNFKKYQEIPIGYRPVRVDWKDLDKCSVCHMDEEYENNLFLQCEKCRMMVHAKCYGELEPVDGVLWLCNLCRPGAPDSTPLCCLCPVIGGAMKPTIDGRWAHLACAIWIPETSLSAMKRMEPIDGLSRIDKDRWNLLCSICNVSYGACIQCSNHTCCVAYHPLCARAAGLCVELEDDERLHLISLDEDDSEDQCVRLLSFCKKHKQPSNQRIAADERIGHIGHLCSDYIPPINPSGCARTEPFNYLSRRGRKAPDALAAASVKRLYVENTPFIVSGYCRHKSMSTNALRSSRFSLLQKLKASEIEDPINVLSMTEKYKNMRKTFKKRLTFGKSRIHGYGIFAIHPHKAGDMVIEYIGELVGPAIADRRERFIYNSLVGAGTYMFRIDDEHVIDATRAGNIAHLINHSCGPNCYSRVISINGEEHIIIFAKRDIRQWEELTYDYRFFSIDDQLTCYCGCPRCRGIVNDTEAEEQAAKLRVPCTELVDWMGE